MGSRCNENTVLFLSSILVLLGLSIWMRQRKQHLFYGRYRLESSSNARFQVPAKVAWIIQELPSFVVPALLTYQSGSLDTLGSKLLFLFCGHYFHRTWIYGYFTRGGSIQISFVLQSFLFCTCNGYLQGHNLIYCTKYDDSWTTDFRFLFGILLFFMGMAFNIHSDNLLRKLREPGDLSYKIPRGGLFEYISAANYFGEIVEWFGYSLATWTYPAFAFALFSALNLGSRAVHHHRFYQQKFQEYPKSRKALIPLLF